MDPDLARLILQVQRERFGLWFYEFDLGHGVKTPVGDRGSMEATSVRKRMVWPVLERTFHGRWPHIDCLDVAAGEGFFAFELARFGPRSVLAIDARESNVEKAKFVARCQGWQNVRIEVRDVYDLSRDQGVFDVSLCLGLLYHVEDPMYVLRRLRAVTRELCVIDTQVAQPGRLSFGWLTSDRRQSSDRVIVIQEELDSDWNRAASITGLGFIPSEAALQLMLQHAGFRKVEKLAPVPSSFDAFETGDRVMLLAWV